ncbi:hypothetical protein IHE45_19G085000 [Dioscorea alata]|uniref:Uncharacterized protein n=1 Tax=Dioscorea alata TaxID=55571 RepID=A0ACB7TZR3_DIOAL|nr:hypothetical protein IHE45_19G085000 [Dioscorea alata]
MAVDVAKNFFYIKKNNNNRLLTGLPPLSLSLDLSHSLSRAPLSKSHPSFPVSDPGPGPGSGPAPAAPSPSPAAAISPTLSLSCASLPAVSRRRSWSRFWSCYGGSLPLSVVSDGCWMRT